MKKLLFFYAGLIMVTASCSFSGNSGNNESNKISDENKMSNNISLFFSGRNGDGVALFDLCYCYFDANTNTLSLEWSSDGKVQKQTFNSSEIAEEYMDNVKNNKVTLIYEDEKFVPAIIEKDTPMEFKNIRGDFRAFTMKSILKGDITSAIMPYKTMYHIYFLLGFTNVGTKILKNGQVFFENKDFKQEITDNSVLKSAGTFSAAYSKDYKFMMCQVVCKDNFLILRMDNGETYRYPMELFWYEENINAIKNGRISAFQMGNGRWMPAIVGKTDSFFWYSELIESSGLYNRMGYKLDTDKYFEFYKSVGLEDMANERNFFFQFNSPTDSN